MTERALFAVAILLGVAALGAVIRVASGRWTTRRSAAIRLPRTESGGPRLLVFSTRFCGDCEIQRHLIEQSRASWATPVDISYHDAASDGDAARRFGILTVSAIVVARNDGRVVGVRQGLVGPDRLRSLIDAAA